MAYEAQMDDKNEPGSESPKFEKFANSFSEMIPARLSFYALPVGDEGSPDT